MGIVIDFISRESRRTSSLENDLLRECIDVLSPEDLQDVMEAMHDEKVYMTLDEDLKFIVDRLAQSGIVVDTLARV